MIVQDKETKEVYESDLDRLMPYEQIPSEVEENTFRAWLDAHDNDNGNND